MVPGLSKKVVRFIKFKEAEPGEAHIPQVRHELACELRKHFILSNLVSISEYIKMALCELICSFMFITLGCFGSNYIAWWAYQDFSHCHEAMTWGFAYTLVIEVGGPLSGAHVNPCVTLAACILGKKALTDLPIYVIMQLVGSTLGHVTVKYVTDNGIHSLPKDFKFCYPTYLPDLEMSQAGMFEFYGSFFFILVCCGLWDSRTRDNIGALSIKLGLAMLGIHMSFGDFTGCFINPTRSLTYALVNEYDLDYIVYVSSPLIGSISAATLYRNLFALPYKMEMANWREAVENWEET